MDNKGEQRRAKESNEEQSRAKEQRREKKSKAKIAGTRSGLSTIANIDGRLVNEIPALLLLVLSNDAQPSNVMLEHKQYISWRVKAFSLNTSWQQYLYVE